MPLIVIERASSKIHRYQGNGTRQSRRPLAGGLGQRRAAILRSAAEALVTVLSTRDFSPGTPLRSGANGELHAALGQAVVRHWSSLTPEIQHDLFEAAILAYLIGLASGD
jgi:hypothetical protein